MAKLLFITCNLASQGHSRTLLLGYEFLNEYLRWHPQDEIHILDLYRDPIQHFDQDVHNALNRISRKEEYELLSEDERRKVARMWRLADQFSACSKYVFVTRSINLWFPAEFKMFIDAICIPERTYHLTSNGPEGILPEMHRKSLHLHAGPLFRFGWEQDMSVQYLRTVLNFFKVFEQETVLLHGDSPTPGTSEEFNTARGTLMELARHF